MCRGLAALLALGVCSRASAQHAHEHPAGHAQVPGVPPNVVALERMHNASGTAWQPEVTPHQALDFSEGPWVLMVHGLLFAGYDAQGGERGAKAVTAMGWVMAMVERSFETARLTGRVMVSPEPATVRNGGYPLLLQTGETYRGQPLDDRQHPHDLFMELAALYTQQVTEGLGVQLYVAPAGEPALGPVAFPHRVSAMFNPLASLGHHWQDSSHIRFGVLTAGVFTRSANLEGSWFNGREPDECRWDLDLRRPDSYAARLTVNPTAGLSAQASCGHLASPEALHPDESVNRITASATFVLPLDSEI